MKKSLNVFGAGLAGVICVSLLAACDGRGTTAFKSHRYTAAEYAEHTRLEKEREARKNGGGTNPGNTVSGNPDGATLNPKAPGSELGPIKMPAPAAPSTDGAGTKTEGSKTDGTPVTGGATETSEGLSEETKAQLAELPENARSKVYGELMKLEPEQRKLVTLADMKSLLDKIEAGNDAAASAFLSEISVSGTTSRPMKVSLKMAVNINNESGESVPHYLFVDDAAVDYFPQVPPVSAKLHLTRDRSDAAIAVGDKIEVFTFCSDSNCKFMGVVIGFSTATERKYALLAYEVKTKDEGNLKAGFHLFSSNVAGNKVTAFGGKAEETQAQEVKPEGQTDGNTDGGGVKPPETNALRKDDERPTTAGLAKEKAEAEAAAKANAEAKAKKAADAAKLGENKFGEGSMAQAARLRAAEINAAGTQTQKAQAPAKSGESATDIAWAKNQERLKQQQLAAASAKPQNQLMKSDDRPTTAGIAQAKAEAQAASNQVAAAKAAANKFGPGSMAAAAQVRNDERRADGQLTAKAALTKPDGRPTTAGIAQAKAEAQAASAQVAAAKAAANKFGAGSMAAAAQVRNEERRADGQLTAKAAVKNGESMADQAFARNQERLKQQQTAALTKPDGRPTTAGIAQAKAEAQAASAQIAAAKAKKEQETAEADRKAKAVEAAKAVQSVQTGLKAK